MIRYSIIVCSHDRASDAGECIGALAAQIDDAAEIILIDSASSPSQAAALSSLQSRFPGLKFRRLDTPGVSKARNAGLSLAEGEWAIFVDDDALPFPDWYARLRESLDNAPPDRAGIGGAVLPKWPDGARAPRLTQQWKTYLSIVDSDTPGSVRSGKAVVAANYAIRAKALAATSNFNENIGRSGSSLISGGDSHVTKHLLDSGNDVWYDPSFGVHHKISAERLRQSWILRRIFMEGVSEVRLHQADGRIPAHLRVAKLAASIPLLMVAATLFFWKAEPKYRLVRAAGGLREHLKPGLN